jgi:hypothetical protein
MHPLKSHHREFLGANFKTVIRSTSQQGIRLTFGKEVKGLISGGTFHSYVDYAQTRLIAPTLL